MATPSLICRGKNLHLAVMKQFLYALPKQDMDKDSFYDYAEKRMPGFTTTHSQIARQMALYYCDINDVCHVRFTSDPSLSEILQYSKFWAEHYFVPNPYTPSFPISAMPTCVYGFIRANYDSPKYNGHLDKLFHGMFNLTVNEQDKAKAYLLQFTDMFEEENNKVGFPSSAPLSSIQINISRNDMEGYYHYFDTWKDDEEQSQYKANVGQTPINDFSDFIKQLEDDIRGAGLVYAEGLMRRFVCAQLAKPFVVLTGLSGSGKTKLAQAFTEWIAVENTAKIVPVGADWTNSEKMLGYPNALDPDKYVLPDTGVLKLMLDARDNPGLPFFLILDEMNLSHVERYFADFLSTMESEGTIKLYDGKERSADDGTPVPSTLEWPKNLFVIGTMNVDETTYMFSPKVLDRAHVIEFRVLKQDIEGFLDAPGAPDMTALKGKGAPYAEAFLKLAEGRKGRKPATTELAAVKTALAGMFEDLAKLGSEFGYRSAGEIVNFIAYYLEASGYGAMPAGTGKQKCLTAAIDAAVVQKLLPKLHGSLNRLGPVLDALIEKSVKKIQPANDPDAEPVLQIIYALTYEKLLRMKERVEKNGFTSFAEA